MAKTFLFVFLAHVYCRPATHTVLSGLKQILPLKKLGKIVTFSFKILVKYKFLVGMQEGLVYIFFSCTDAFLRLQVTDLFGSPVCHARILSEMRVSGLSLIFLYLKSTVSQF